jgi:hypothetical protein
MQMEYSNDFGQLKMTDDHWSLLLGLLTFSQIFLILHDLNPELSISSLFPRGPIHALILIIGFYCELFSFIYLTNIGSIY